MYAAGGAFGVLIGGLLTEYAGWRWVMFVNVPMAAGALGLALHYPLTHHPLEKAAWTYWVPPWAPRA